MSPTNTSEQKNKPANRAMSQWLERHPANATVQPFPSVWPVRTLRSDVEPADLVARLGLYSMDNGTPLVAGTWAAAKAGADAAVSAAALVEKSEQPTARNDSAFLPFALGANVNHRYACGKQACQLGVADVDHLGACQQ